MEAIWNCVKTKKSRWVACGRFYFKFRKFLNLSINLELLYRKLVYVANVNIYHYSAARMALEHGKVINYLHSIEVQ